ncbi:phage integrase family protein [Rhodovulum kholense]|uniref:Phage integrase family protein n=2 Tax=Rhodovulum kholense TaxID=453584 RepID=A0A8E2VLJ3_9RHOB|nr:phage integrase family protein [Rhodovulum kholense]
MARGQTYEPWPENKLLAFEAVCEEHSVEPIIYELAIGTGQRLGDCISMKWDDFDSEYMKVVQEKTSAKIQVYCPTRLQRFLETIPRNGTFILAKNRTQHMGKRQVQKRVEDIRKAIGVLSGQGRLAPHGWRYTAATQLADAGVDMRDIQTVTGHKTLSMVQKYTAQANPKAASRRAQTAREQSRNETGKR